MVGRPHWNPDVKTIGGVPTVRECYWFSIPSLKAPEIPDWHPCVVVRGARGGDERQHTVTIVPLTSTTPSQPRDDIFALSANPNPTDRRPVWALGEFVMPVGLFRLEYYTTRRGDIVVPRITKGDLDGILDSVVNGITVLNRRIDDRISAIAAERDAEFSARIEEYERTFEERVEEAVMRRLDEMTRS